MTRHRWIAFLVVGALGLSLQLVMLVLLVRSGWHYLAATAASVALTVLHNFAWHERWTWADRTSSARGTLKRLARFTTTTGATSLLGNVGFTAAYVGLSGLPAPAASILAVASVSLANFLIADRWVFVSSGQNKGGRNDQVGDETRRADGTEGHAAVPVLRSRVWRRPQARDDRSLGFLRAAHRGSYRTGTLVATVCHSRSGDGHSRRELVNARSSR